MEKNSSKIASWGISNVIAVIILGAILVIGGSLLGNHVSSKQTQQVAGAEALYQPVVEKTISYNGQDGKSALDILKADHKITSQNSSIGVFITGIDGTDNQDNKYWMFYVNGQLATTGADQYITKNTDKIEWRFESLQ